MESDLQARRDQNRKLHEDFLATLGIYKHNKDPHQKAVKKTKGVIDDIETIQTMSYEQREDIINSLREMWPCRERHLFHLANHLAPCSLLTAHISQHSSGGDFKCQSPLLLQGPSGTGKKGLLRGVLQNCNIRHIWVDCHKLLPPCGPGRTEYSTNQLSSILFSDILQQICDRYSARYSVKKKTLSNAMNNSKSIIAPRKSTVGDSDIDEEDMVDQIRQKQLNSGGSSSMNRVSKKKTQPNNKKSSTASSSSASSSSSCKDIHSFIYALHKLLPPVITKSGHVTKSTTEHNEARGGEQEREDDDTELAEIDYSSYFEHLAAGAAAQVNQEGQDNVQTTSRRGGDTNSSRQRFQLVHDFDLDKSKEFQEIDNYDALSSNFAPKFVIAFSQAERLYEHDVIHASESVIPQIGLLNQLFKHYQISSRRKLLKKLLKKQKQSSSSSSSFLLTSNEREEEHDWLSRTSKNSPGSSSFISTSHPSGRVSNFQTSSVAIGGGGSGSNSTSTMDALYGCSWVWQLVFTVSERLYIEGSKLKNGRLIGQIPITIIFSSYSKEELKPILIAELKRLNTVNYNNINDSGGGGGHEEVVVDHLLNVAYGVCNVRILRRAALLILQSARLNNSMVHPSSSWLSKVVDKAIKNMHRPDFGVEHLSIDTSSSSSSSSAIPNSSIQSSSINKMIVNLPPRMKFLILAAYISGVTSSENDVKKFTPGEQGKRKRSKHSAKNDNEQSSSKNKLPTRGLFGLQRLLALFGFLLEDYGTSLDTSITGSSSSSQNGMSFNRKHSYLYSDSYSGVTMVHVAELVKLSLLEKNNQSSLSSISNNSSASGATSTQTKRNAALLLSSCPLSEPSYRSLVSSDLAFFLAAHLKINLEKYL